MRLSGCDASPMAEKRRLAARLARRRRCSRAQAYAETPRCSPWPLPPRRERAALPAAAAAGCADCAEGGKRAAIFRRFAAVLPMLRISLAPTRPTKQIETGPRESHMECETRLYPEIVCPPCLFPAAAARLAPRAGQVAGPVSSSKRKRRRVGGRPRRERACFPAPRDRCCVRRLAPGSARCLTRRRQEHRRLQVEREIRCLLVKPMGAAAKRAGPSL